MKAKEQTPISLLLACLCWLAAGPAAAEPFIPKDDATVLERLPAGRSADPEPKRLRAELARDPSNLELALDLAGRYLEIGRAAGDPRYQGYAEAALAPWWTAPDPPPGVLLLRATIRQNRHDFAAALADLDRLLRLQPRNAQGWLTRAIVLQVQGDYAAALESCLPVRRYRPLLASACLASAASLSGWAESAYELLHQAIAAAPTARGGDRLWALTGLAEIAARLGRAEDAERHFEEALALEQRDLYLLAAYADFLLDQDRPEDVQKLLADETRSDSLLLRLALAEARLDSPRLGERLTILGDRFAEASLRGEGRHLGAEARFRLHLLDQPAAALDLARRNWAAQREPVDARLVLEAAVAAGDSEAARPVVAWLEESGLEDVRLAGLVQLVKEAGR